MTASSAIAAHLFDAEKPDARAFIHQQSDPRSWPWEKKIGVLTGKPWHTFDNGNSGNEGEEVWLKDVEGNTCQVVVSSDYVTIHCTHPEFVYDSSLKDFYTWLADKAKSKARFATESKKEDARAFIHKHAGVEALSWPEKMSIYGGGLWTEIDGPDSGMGVDHWFKDEGGLTVYVNVDQGHVTISGDGVADFEGDEEEFNDILRDLSQHYQQWRPSTGNHRQ